VAESGESAAAQPITVGQATHYAEFVKLCRQRIEELNISHDTADAIRGFARGYFGKLLVGTKNMSAHSLFIVATTLGLTPVFLHDEAGLERLRRHSAWTPITNPGVLTRRRGAAWQERRSEIEKRVIVLGPDFRRRRAQAGGLAYRKKIGPKRRREIARNAVRARKWRPVGGAQQV
jgi:hypothetical protein